MPKEWTRKHYMVIAIVMSVVLSVVFYNIDLIEVADHRPGNVPLLVINSVLLAVAAAATTVGLLIILTKPDYIRAQILTLSRFRHLLRLMIKRDFVTRYRRSVLGIVWSVLNPLLMMLVFAMVFSTIFRGFAIENFPVYLLSGQLIFNFFSESTNSAMGSILGSAHTIKKVYVPKYIFPVSKVLSSVVNMGFSLVAFVVIMVGTRASFHPTVFLIPIPLIYLILFSMGVGMILSTIAVFFRDTMYIYGIVTTVLMFLTPIFYPVEALSPRVYHLIHLNPLFHYVSYFRDLALNGVVPGLWSNVICIGFALAALCLGVYVKLSQQDKYLLYM